MQTAEGEIGYAPFVYIWKGSYKLKESGEHKHFLY